MWLLYAIGSAVFAALTSILAKIGIDGVNSNLDVYKRQELIRMIRNSGIAFDKVESEACDMPFGIGSGGGVIFGVTGGVTEAALRRMAKGHDKATLDAIANSGIRGDEGIKEAVIPYEGREVKVCVVLSLIHI